MNLPTRPSTENMQWGTNIKANEISSGEKLTFGDENEILFKEGGKNFIYYLFGSFTISNINLDISKTILEQKNWNNELSEIKKISKLQEENSLNSFSGLKFCITLEEENEEEFCNDNKRVSKFNYY